MLAWTLLRRYGVIFRRLLTREGTGVPWRDLVRVYRRLEARGEIRGGRFVTGVSGEQFALPGRRRATARNPPFRCRRSPDRHQRRRSRSISPASSRPAIASAPPRVTRIVYRERHRPRRDGRRHAANVGRRSRRTMRATRGRGCAGRRVPVVSGYVGRRSVDTSDAQLVRPNFLWPTPFRAWYPRPVTSWIPPSSSACVSRSARFQSARRFPTFHKDLCDETLRGEPVIQH